MKQFIASERKYNDIERYLVSYKLDELKTIIETDGNIGHKINGKTYHKVKGIYTYKINGRNGKSVERKFIKSDGYNIMVDANDNKLLDKLEKDRGVIEDINKGIVYCYVDYFNHNGKTYYKIRIEELE